MQTVYFILGLVIVGLAWEFYTLRRKGVRTISRAMKYLGEEWSPFVVYGLSVLVGHFWISPPESYTLASLIPEAQEVAIVLFIGWGIFGYFRANRDQLPLLWWQNIILILVSLSIGGFVWTIGA